MKNEKKQEQAQVSTGEMTEKDMVNLLVELTNTSYWGAIKRYNRERDKVISQIFDSLDPYKDMTQFARAQGNRIGLYDLEIGIEQEKKRREKKVKENITEIK